MSQISSPLVSIIIPCYNGAAFVRQAIESVLNQSYPHIEIIVVDDGSTDSSLDIIRSYGHRICIETGSNRGPAAARNRGLEVAQGSYIKFLDADDLLLEQCLSQQVAQALSLTEPAIVYGDAVWVDQQCNVLIGHPHRPCRPDEDPIAHILEQSPLTSCPLHKRDYLLRIGGFDTSLPRDEEVDLHLRLVLAGIRFVYHPSSVYWYRQHQSTGRVSHQAFSRYGPATFFDLLTRQSQAIEAKRGGRLSPEICTILARRYWVFGRSILREGFPNEAPRYFAEARRLDPLQCVVGNSPYPVLVKLLGPERAEYVAGVLHRIIGK